MFVPAIVWRTTSCCSGKDISYFWGNPRTFGTVVLPHSCLSCGSIPGTITIIGQLYSLGMLIYFSLSPFQAYEERARCFPYGCAGEDHVRDG